MALPANVCLKSAYNQKYLRYRYEDVQTHGLLQFAGEKIMDSYAQFEVIKSNRGDGLVHLKSRYSDKFLVRWSPNHNWISASAEAPNEDEGYWACTLFKPILINEGNPSKLRLMHVQLRYYACLWRADAPFDSCLMAGSDSIDKDSCDVFEVMDWASVFKLPKQVAFKGENGKYLGAISYNGASYLQFSFDNPNDSKVVQEVFSEPDGTICMKSNHTGQFWRLEKDDYIKADMAEDPRVTKNANGLFRTDALDINSIALLNMGKTWYCQQYTSSKGDPPCLLNASAQNVDRFAMLEVKELGK